MRFDVYSMLFSPYFLLFLTLCLGIWFGGWKKMGRMKFGVGGPLFIGIPLGWLCYRIASALPEGHAGYAAAQKFMETGAIPSDMRNFVLIMFVAAIGLLASHDLKLVLKKYGIKFIILGIVITFIGAVGSCLSARIIPGSNVYEASGIYTGALTSSPGLGMAMESSEKKVIAMAKDTGSLTNEQKEELAKLYGGTQAETIPNETQVKTAVKTATGYVGTGYAVAYPFGMLAVILAMLFIPKIFRIDTEAELEIYRQEIGRYSNVNECEEEQASFDLKSYAFVCVIGYLLGNVEIYLGSLGYFSLGMIGGVLLVSIGFGSKGKLGPFRFHMNNKILGVIRDLTLACYIGMVGLSYGNQVIESLLGSGIFLVIASLVISVICILAGFFLGHRVFKMNWILLSGAICGGMTSTPGLGMATDSLKCDDPATGYAATYPFALICMVLFTNIMYNL